MNRQPGTINRTKPLPATTHAAAAMSAPPTPRLRLSRPGDPSRPTQPLKSALSTPTKRKRPVLEDDPEEPPESLEDELESMSLDLELSMGTEEDIDMDPVGYPQTTQQHLTVPGSMPGPAKRRREQRSASEPRRGLHGLQGLRGLTPPRSPELDQGMQRKRLRSPPPEPVQGELELEQEEEETTEVALVKSTPLQKYARALRRKEQIQNYKSREIKESREKRTAERRRRRSQSSASRAVELEAINAAANARLVVDSPQKKVQFIV
ncbi:hypothetical protein BZA77DRAFT_309800 [Pyronema omphalodes]|nr:hypothetical protein BZA77DRAFT_309800 [Pyronema omphalodes]